MILPFTHNRPAGRVLSTQRQPINGRTISRLVVPLAFILMLALGAGSALAMPLAEYRSRLHEAMTVLDELWESEDEISATEFDARSTAVLTTLEELVPADEAVEWEGGWVRVNNSWLAEEVRKFRELPSRDERRVNALVRIVQRVGAIE